MFRQFIVIAFLLSGVVFGQGQVGTRPSSGGNTYNITNQRTDVESWFTAVDTTALKTLTGSEGSYAYLKQLSSANTNGGGWFVAIDSSDHGSILTTATKGALWFEHPTTDRVWIREIYLNQNRAYLRDFGAIGDGITDDYEAINEAFQSEIPLVGKSGVTYLVGEKFSLRGYDLDISSSGSEPFTISIDQTGLSDYDIIMNIGGNASSDTTTLADSVWVNTNSCIVADGSIFSAGDIIEFRSDSAWQVARLSADKGEIHRVLRVEVDTVYIEDHFWTNYSSDPEAVSVVKIDANIINIKGMKIKTSTDSVSTVKLLGLEIRYTKDSVLENVTVMNFSYNCLYIMDNYNLLVTGGEYGGARLTGLGYGIACEGNNILKITEAVIQNSIKGIDVGEGVTYPCRNILISNNHFLNCAAGVGGHSGVEAISVIGNIFSQCGTGIIIKGSDAFISSNKFHGKMSYCITFTNHFQATVPFQAASNMVVDNNYYSPSQNQRQNFTSNDTTSYYMAIYFISITSNDTSDNAYYAFTNNKAYGIRSYFLNMVLSESVTLHNVTVANNICRFYNPDPTSECVFQNGRLHLENSRLMNNDVAIMNGSAITEYDYADAYGWDYMDWSGERDEYAMNDTLTVDAITYSAGNLVDTFWSKDSLLQAYSSGDTAYIGSKKNKYSIHFDPAIDDYMIRGDTTIYEVEDEDFSMGFWVKHDSLDQLQRWWSSRESSPDQAFARINSTNHPSIFYIQDASNKVALMADGVADTLDTGWHWVLFTVDRSDTGGCFIYIDGDTVESYVNRITSAFNIDINAPSQWGRSSTGDHEFGGYIYESVFWLDSVLTYEANTALYNSGVPVDPREGAASYPAPTQYFKMFMGAGTNTYDIMTDKYLVLQRASMWSRITP